MRNIRSEIAISTLNYLKDKDWDSISIEKMKRNKRDKKSKYSNIIKNKNDLLININRYFDDQLKSSSDYIDNSTPKDMIFEVMMMRFDLLNKYRVSIVKIFNFFKKNPKTFVTLIPSFIESIITMSNIAELKINGIKGHVKINGLLIIYFSTFLIWLKDNNPSLDKTMTNLDKYLLKAEKIMNLIN